MNSEIARTRSKRIIGPPWLVAGALLAATPVAAKEVVIANPTVPTDTIEASELERVFLGKSSKVGGDHVEIVVLREGQAHADFLTSYVRKSPKQFLSHWRKLCFTGKGSMPHTFRTEEELVAYVAATPGSIGYVDDRTPHHGVKTLVVRN